MLNRCVNICWVPMLGWFLTHDIREYEKRVALYNEPVWTCQCTGQIKLRHEEACQSEQKVQSYLKENFEEIYEQPVLELVHHSE